jgi:hypothetical protein
LRKRHPAPEKQFELVVIVDEHTPYLQPSFLNSFNMVFEVPRRRFMRTINSKYIYGIVVSVSRQ